MHDHPSATVSIRDLLASMEATQASDLFIAEGKPPTLRVHGQIVPLDHPPATRGDLEDLLALTLTPGMRRTLEEEGDLDVGFTLDDGHRFRVNLSRQQGRMAAVLRALPLGHLDFRELRLPEGLPTLFESLRGLVLVTGATGSGKSTTLAAMVHHINATRPVHIITIEDPIEFVHRDLIGRVSQREVGADTRSFHRALRQVVRQSPDVILIGELRDQETMQVAISAALTGHLVLTSLHTVDTAQTLQRILAYFPEHLKAQVALDLSNALKGIVCQRLLPRADGLGRVPAVELMVNTPATRRLLREQRVDDLIDMVRTSTASGMVSFSEALLQRHQAGMITYETGLAYATNPEEFTLWTKGMISGVQGSRGKREGAATRGLDLKVLLGRAMDLGASDLHLAAGRAPIVRVTGTLRRLGDHVLSDADMRMLLHSIMSNRQREIYELEREVDFAIGLEDGRRFRVNAYFQRGQMAAALRAIPDQVPQAESLGIPEVVIGLGERSHGLLLVVGPTGSGKSTTLACLLDRINRSRSCRIITIEDPIEYVHKSHRATVDQREIHADSMSFAAALKYILRQDPDVILVGEMRDAETMSAALTAAETGHLVLSTLHTNDAAQAVDRIVDSFSPHQQTQVRSQLAACLLGVISQRLLPRADGQGRVPAFEVMVATTGIRTLVRENKMHQANGLMEAARRDGCVTMDQSLQALYAARTVTFEQAMRHLRNPRAISPEGGAEPSADPSTQPSGSPTAEPRRKLPWSR
ncbi:MAG: PilT/PilU family type 4a pilus ATPase [Pseudomonadota bacterium]